jgi:hypothetical protein
MRGEFDRGAGVRSQESESGAPTGKRTREDLRRKRESTVHGVFRESEVAGVQSLRKIRPKKLSILNSGS